MSPEVSSLNKLDNVDSPWDNRKESFLLSILSLRLTQGLITYLLDNQRTSVQPVCGLVGFWSPVV